MMALEPEFSGDSAFDGVNRGVGLYFARRLALAASGAFVVITEQLSATASAKTPSTIDPTVGQLPQRWKGTAVAVTFSAEGADYDGPMTAIKDEIEGRGPRYQDIAFYAKSDGAEGWHTVRVGVDKGGFAIDRTRAEVLARDELLPRLARGEKIELDFTGVANTTQPFCHALLVPLLRSGGEDVLGRLRFIGCGARARSPIRFAISYGLNGDA